MNMQCNEIQSLFDRFLNKRLKRKEKAHLKKHLKNVSIAEKLYGWKKKLEGVYPTCPNFNVLRNSCGESS